MGDHHQFRAVWHDYNAGIYFVTVCTAGHRHYFGRIADGEMILNAIGEIVDGQIRDIPLHYRHVELWNHVVMPNHIHLVVYISHSVYVGTTGKIGCLRPSAHEPRENQDFHHCSSLSVIIRQLKGRISRIVSEKGMIMKWQGRYHEHIIRDQHRYELIMNYIDENVMRWTEDRYNNLKEIDRTQSGANI